MNMPSRKLEHVRVQSIQALPSRRKIDPETVSRLVESIGKIGLRTPITVRYVNAAPVLVTGAHRLAAVKELGWDRVECFVFFAAGGDETLITRGDDEITAKLWEISENLDRAELTALERSELIAEWIRLTEKKPSQAVSSQVGTKVGRPESGINAAARDLGISKTAAHRATKIAAIPEKAKQAARDAGLDRNQAALEKIAKADKPVQAVKAISKPSRKPKQDPVKVYDKAAAMLPDLDGQGCADLAVREIALLARDPKRNAQHLRRIDDNLADKLDNMELAARIKRDMDRLVERNCPAMIKSAVLYGAGLPEVKAGVHVPRSKPKKAAAKKPANVWSVSGDGDDQTYHVRIEP